jgi:hypothetical protein
MLHEELNRTALLVAHETAIGVSVSRLGDARRPHDEVAVVLVVMERAQPSEVHASFAEVNEVTHDILNLREVNHSLYYFVGYLWHNILHYRVSFPCALMSRFFIGTCQFGNRLLPVSNRLLPIFWLSDAAFLYGCRFSLQTDYL